MTSARMLSTFKDWYEVLGVADTATVNDLKKAYRKMALRWHPEKNPANKTEAERRFTEIAQAYQILTNGSHPMLQRQEVRELAKAKNPKEQSDAEREEFDRVRYFHTPSALVTSRDPRFTFRDPLAGAAYPDFASLRQASQTHPPTDRTNGVAEEPQLKFRDPHEIFREFFGGREPFIEAFSDVEGSTVSVPCTGIPHQFDQTLPTGFLVLGASPGLTSSATGMEFPSGETLEALKSGFTLPGLNNQSTNHGNGFSSPSGGLTSPKGSSSIRHVTTSTRIHNGRKIVTKKVMENGVEIVTVEEDGKLTSKTVNGEPVDVNPTLIDPLLCQPVVNTLPNQSPLKSSNVIKPDSPINSHVTTAEVHHEIKPSSNGFSDPNSHSVAGSVSSLCDVTNKKSPKEEREKENVREEIKRSTQHITQQIQDPLRDFSSLTLS